MNNDTASHTPTPDPVGCKCKHCGHVHEWKRRIETHFTTVCPMCGDMMYDQLFFQADPDPSLKAEAERLRAALTQVKNDLSEAAAPLFNKVPKVWDDLRQVHLKAEHALSLVSESTTLES